MQLRFFKSENIEEKKTMPLSMSHILIVYLSRDYKQKKRKDKKTDY